ncbi:MAG: carbonic anhydrase [Fimbriimonas sp.]
MDKIVKGISTFHETGAHEVRPLLSHLAVHGQKPQALMITCADSRIMPEELTQADPGDLFMIRNIGNLVPHAVEAGAGNDTSVAAALDYALVVLHVKDIVVMGHSGCGAMAALHGGGTPLHNVNAWLRHGQASMERHRETDVPSDELGEVDRLSQTNVLESVENLRTYQCVKDRLETGELTLHAWWFDVGNAQILACAPGKTEFKPIEEAYAVHADAYAG